MSDTMRVFVNGKALDAPGGGTALDAVRVQSAPSASAVESGAMLITDSRGLPVPADTPLHNGAVFRLVPNRDRDAADPATQFDS